MEGTRILHVDLRRPDLRFAFPAGFVERLTGRTIVALRRRAKYLCADLADGTVLIMHLGMSGSFRTHAAETDAEVGRFYIPRGKLAAHDHVVFELSSGVSIIYNDPRRFGFMDLASRATFDDHPLMRAIGVEPLGNVFGPGYLHGVLEGRKTPLKSALLDQKLIAGLGNIYVCEALWRAKLSPLRLAGSIAEAGKRPNAQVKLLASSIRAVLEEAIEAGGSSLRDYVQTSGELGYFQHRFRVYDCEDRPCTRDGCHGVIVRVVQSGRSTFYCAVCQV